MQRLYRPTLTFALAIPASLLPPRQKVQAKGKLSGVKYSNLNNHANPVNPKNPGSDKKRAHKYALRFVSNT
jgi:hypothetical protein